MDSRAMWKEAQTHLCTLCRYLGAAERGWGSQQHATYIILFESSILNTGEPERNVKESGKEAGETRTETPRPGRQSNWP